MARCSHKDKDGNLCPNDAIKSAFCQLHQDEIYNLDPGVQPGGGRQQPTQATGGRYRRTQAGEEREPSGPVSERQSRGNTPGTTHGGRHTL
jgi:hypothetical protein